MGVSCPLLSFLVPLCTVWALPQLGHKGLVPVDLGVSDVLTSKLCLLPNMLWALGELAFPSSTVERLLLDEPLAL
jgi:hypothetical protein